MVSVILASLSRRVYQLCLNLDKMFSLTSNAIKFTHEGKVGIKLYVVAEQHLETKQNCHEKISLDQSKVSESTQKEDKCLSATQSLQRDSCMRNHREASNENDKFNDEPSTPNRSATMMCEEEENHSVPQETTVWLRCDVYDTGIGIPGNVGVLLFFTISIQFLK